MLIKIFFVFVFGGAGLILAFVPIEGRPADLMVSYFFKAVFQPNQYIYAKQGITFPYLQLSATPMITATQKNTPLGETPLPQHRVPTTLLDMQLAQSQAAPPVQQPSTQNTPTQENIPAANTAQQVVPPIQPQEPTQQGSQLPPATPLYPQGQQHLQTVTEPVQAIPAPEEKNTALEDQLQQTIAEKEQLKKQLELMQEQLKKTSEVTQPTNTPPTSVKAPVASATKTIPTPPTIKSSLIAPDFPNIVMGVVRDARGNVLPNILIEVKDTNNNPVRAFKTNALGQFASATPLLNGTYTIIFEDPAKTHTFDALEIVAKGEIMQPIEIISLDKREELRKELFG